jgi:hypothetical protein
MRIHVRSWRYVFTALLVVALFQVESPTARSDIHRQRRADLATVSGKIWRVPGDFSDIQSAINAAATGDTVLVAAGSYTGSLNFSGKAITVQSADGPTATAIIGNGGTTITIGSSGALIGFTVSHGVGYDGGGMTVVGTGTLIRGNIFTDNAALVGGTGAAIAGNGASPLIDSNVFRQNTCDTQLTAGVVVFVGQSAPQIINNLFVDNPCRAINMTLPMEAAPRVSNNTIVGNSVGIRVDARVPTVGHFYRNNLLVGNTVGLVVDFSVAPAYYPTWEYNLVFGNTTNYEGIPDQTGLLHNLSADPLFVDAAHGVYALQTTSPAIDAGSTVQCPSHDSREVARPQGQLCDIGAYEVIQVRLGFAAETYHAQENIGTVPITITLDQAIPISATVAYTTATSPQGNASTPGVDYEPKAGTLIFPPGSTSQAFSISILDDRADEGNEVLLVILSNANALDCKLTVEGPATLTIVDNDIATYIAIVRRP